MALTKAKKVELLDQYRSWLKDSRAVFFTEYTGVNMKQLDEMRIKMRELGGELHVVKNRLGRLAFEEAGLLMADELFTGSTMVGFAFEDAPATAKAIAEFAEKIEWIKVKGGYLGALRLDAAGVKTLAELPPLPVVRARLLGTLLAPASQLVRMIAEPGRRLAAVIQARADQAAG